MPACPTLENQEWGIAFSEPNLGANWFGVICLIFILNASEVFRRASLFVDVGVDFFRLFERLFDV